MSNISLKFIYFPNRAKGEAIKMLLRHTKTPFENQVVWAPEFRKMKPDLPGGQLPVLVVDGKMYPESGSILRFVGHLTGSVPTDPVQFLKAETAYEFSRKLDNINPIINRFVGEQLENIYDNYFEELPTRLKFLSGVLGDAEFFGGSEACYADFGIWHFLDCTVTVKSGSIEPENLKAWMKRVAELPEVAKYLSERLDIKEERLRLIESLRERSAGI